MTDLHLSKTKPKIKVKKYQTTAVYFHTFMGHPVRSSPDSQSPGSIQIPQLKIFEYGPQCGLTLNRPLRLNALEQIFLYFYDTIKMSFENHEKYFKNFKLIYVTQNEINLMKDWDHRRTICGWKYHVTVMWHQHQFHVMVMWLRNNWNKRRKGSDRTTSWIYR